MKGEQKINQETLKHKFNLEMSVRCVESNYKDCGD